MTNLEVSMSKHVFGPFLFMVFLVATVLCVGAGVYWAVTTLPWWVGTIVGAFLFAGWLVDRMMFYAINLKKKSNVDVAQKLADACIKKAMDNIKNKPPFIPPVDKGVN